MLSKKQEHYISTLERGDIFFFYRPRAHPVGEEPSPDSPDDIERSYIVLRRWDTR